MQTVSNPLDYISILITTSKRELFSCFYFLPSKTYKSDYEPPAKGSEARLQMSRACIYRFSQFKPQLAPNVVAYTRVHD